MLNSKMRARVMGVGFGTYNKVGHALSSSSGTLRGLCRHIKHPATTSHILTSLAGVGLGTNQLRGDWAADAD